MSDLPLGPDEALAQQRERFGFAWRDCAVIDLGVDTRSPWGSVYKDWGFTRADGREMRLSSLHQSMAYGGMLCGLPNLWNDRQERAEDAARRQYPDHNKPIAMLRPELLKGRIEPAAGVAGRSVGWEGLPPICCIAEFIAGGSKTDEFSGYSMVVVWWQRELGLPDEAAIAQLRELSWERFAWGWEF